MIAHPSPPGPPGPPSHRHNDGAKCWWVRRGSIDQWRRVESGGRDLGPCPGFPDYCGRGPCCLLDGHEGRCTLGD